MRLVVTRPQHDAVALAERLGALGHEALVEPMLTVVAAGDGASIAGRWRAILVTSANGVRALARRPEAAGLLADPVLAVGAASAQAARQEGFASVTGADGDLPALVALVRATIAPGEGRLLYAAGQTVSGDLAAILGDCGYDVERRVLYDAVPADRLSRPVARAIEAGTVDGVLLFSRRTARVWARVTAQQGLAPGLARLAHFCLSAAVAEEIVAAMTPRPPLLVAARPDTDTLLRLLDR